jgi:hypothetical protein
MMIRAAKWFAELHAVVYHALRDVRPACDV